ncbi:SPOUT methyltransferase [Saccharomyces pastorianus]|uniref:SPOUT methyltransferase n=1 Tax=Saccharomyces pastorianus TaxID=27292 RepID=A0A6C1E8Z5_SACPS|nr:SFM1-like protein [Saccharomyces eubayanus]KOG96536.1 SFM1-like protein [Saccharomyces eubayanus]QID85401.1 SPOUT methyltransferase [Saccharomyces pastorianus]
MKYIIEHMEEGFSEWVILEYSQILRDVGAENLILSSLPKNTTEKDIPEKLLSLGLRWTTSDLKNIDEDFKDLEPLKDGRVCLLDPRAAIDLQPEDAAEFDYFVFGGILGDHPPRDRTKELKTTYPNLLVGRRLGDKQMTTDTAIRTTQLIVKNKTKFEDIKFIDYPEFRFNKNEATEMPFRYVLDKEGRPILPEGMLELIKKDSAQSLDDLLM